MPTPTTGSDPSRDTRTTMVAVSAPTSGQTMRFAQRRNWAVAVAALVGVALTVFQLEGETGLWIDAVDWVIWVVFAVDLAFDIREDAPWTGFWQRHWVSIVIVVVTFPLTPVLRHGMRLACLARAARPLRLLTATSVAAHGLRATVGHRGAACVATVTVMVIATSAGALLAVEPDLTHGSYWDGVWWAIVTATTVDYGDIAPATVRGRVIATTLMLTGIGLVSTLSGSISAYFVVGEDPHQLRQIEARLGRIEALLAEVRRDRARGSAREATVPGDVGTQDPVALARGDHASQPTGEASLLRFDTEKRDLIGAGDLPVGRSG